MTISSTFSIEGTSVANGLVTVDPGDTVDLAVLDTTGMASIVWSCIGTHVATVTPASITALITPAGVPSGATASFVMPAGNTGQAYHLKCHCTDDYGNTSTTYGLVGCINEAGVVPFAAGEQLARHATQGWTDAVNAALRGTPDDEYHATTVDAVATTAITVVLPWDSVSYIQYVATGHGQTSDSVLHNDGKVVYKRIGGAVPTLVGQSLFDLDEDGAWAVSHAVVGNDVVFSVTGDAAEDVNWDLLTYRWTTSL